MSEDYYVQGYQKINLVQAFYHDFVYYDIARNASHP